MAPCRPIVDLLRVTTNRPCMRMLWLTELNLDPRIRNLIERPRDPAGPSAGRTRLSTVKLTATALNSVASDHAKLARPSHIA